MTALPAGSLDAHRLTMAELLEALSAREVPSLRAELSEIRKRWSRLKPHPAPDEVAEAAAEILTLVHPALQRSKDMVQASGVFARSAASRKAREKLTQAEAEIAVLCEIAFQGDEICDQNNPPGVQADPDKTGRLAMDALHTLRQAKTGIAKGGMGF